MSAVTLVAGPLATIGRAELAQIPGSKSDLDLQTHTPPPSHHRRGAGRNPELAIRNSHERILIGDLSKRIRSLFQDNFDTHLCLLGNEHFILISAFEL